MVLNFKIRGTYSLPEMLAAIEGEEAYGEQLTRLGVGVGTAENWADFEPVPQLAARLAADVVPTDAALADAIRLRGPSWRLILVTTVLVSGKRERVALFREQP